MTRPATNSGTEQSSGLFGYVVLKAVKALGDNAYGQQISRVLYDLTGASIVPARVYLTLKRLEDRGFISARKEPREGVACRNVVIFTLTAEGALQIAAAERLISAATRIGDGNASAKSISVSTPKARARKSARAHAGTGSASQMRSDRGDNLPG